MNAMTPRPAGSAAGAHPAVLGRRARELTLLAVVLAIAAGLAVGISELISTPNWVLTAAGLIGGAGLLFLMFNSRLELSVALLAIYLGCLDGPVKLLSGGGNAVSALRDVLIFIVAIGALGRLAARREPIRLPPMSGWVFAFVALVVVEAINPNTVGTLKILAGFRQQLEWLPFFFFGYALMRSRERLRKLFLLLGLIALANGLVAAYQSRLSPQQLASWGPGYAEKVNGVGGSGGDTFAGEGGGHVRPLGLGSDIGFAGSVGMLALPATLALMSMAGTRRRWPIAILSLGALLAVATSESRTGVLGAIVALLGFGTLSLSAGRQVMRPLAAMLVLVVLGVGLVTVLSSTGSGSIFTRYSSIAPEKVGSSAPDYKEVSLKQIPKDIANDPFGFGLGTAGAASGVGGKSTVQLEGHGFSSETEFNFLMNETGLPGLALFVALLVWLLWMAATRIRQIGDVDTRIALAGVFGALVGLTLTGFAGAFTSGQTGAYFWFIAGIGAYWLAGPGRFADKPLSGAGSTPRMMHEVV